jgi:GDP-4-dehydro-6-deoxy-D-mannose reductase
VVSGFPLVTGATGFAGGHLLDLLLQEEPSVFGWGNPGGRAVSDGPPRDCVSWSTVDITDVDAVERALADSRPSAVYHLAGMADVHGAWSDASSALRVNVMGTHALLSALERCRLHVPVLVTGSALVYRASADVLTEESAIGPSGPYGVSKLAQEMIASRADSCIITRPFNHAGPRQSSAYATSSFARQIAEAEAGRREPVLRVGNLDARRDITDVRDTVRAYRLLVGRGVAGRPYNVCRGEAYRVGDLLDALVRQSTVAIRIEVDPTRLRPSDNPVVLGSFDRLAAATGWRPEIPIERTLADLLDYWRGAVRNGSAPR